MALDPTNQPFDPNAHQAMSMVPGADVAPNTVIAVMQKGYRLNGRVIRPAMVMVSSPLTDHAVLHCPPLGGLLLMWRQKTCLVLFGCQVACMRVFQGRT